MPELYPFISLPYSYVSLGNLGATERLHPFGSCYGVNFAEACLGKLWL